MASENNDDQDLPLPSLQSDFVANHYQLHLDCQVDSKRFLGVVNIFLKRAKISGGNRLILDAKNLKIHAVQHHLNVSPEDVDKFLGDVEQKQCRNSFQHWFKMDCEEFLDFQQTEWSVIVDMTCCNVPPDAAVVIQIMFSTKDNSSSVLWTKDDAGYWHFIFPLSYFLLYFVIVKQVSSVP